MLHRLRFIGPLVAVLVLSLGVSHAGSTPTELFFSEYIEGTSNNKALEIYNGTGAPVNLGTQGYNVQMCFNGNPSCTLTINLTGTVATGDVYVLAHASASATILAQADQTNGSGWFNGDDAVVLRRGTTVLDVIGQVGFDPGSEWGSGLTSTADNTLRRNGGIEAGDANGSDAFDPAAQWDGYATDTFDGLGSHNAGGDPAPRVASSSPANGATEVAVDANVTLTFSEDVNATGDWATIACTVSGPHPSAITGGPRTFTVDPADPFAAGEDCTVTVAAANVSDRDAVDPPDNMSADARITFSTVGVAARIYEIQGRSHVSPLRGRRVSGVPGVVTAVRPSSFYMEDATGDADQATSDGILVFGVSTTGLAAGQAVLVDGRVTEFRPGGSTGTNNLSITELTQAAVTPAGPATAAAPTVIGAGGRMPPTATIDDDTSGDIEAGATTFDPAQDGIDFYESLEGMLVQVNDAVVVGPTKDFGEFVVLADRGAAAAGVRTPRGGILYRYADGNPERITVDDEILRDAITPRPSRAMPDANVGDLIGSAIVGPLDYSFANFKIQALATPTVVSGGLQREVAIDVDKESRLSVATFNVENLHPGAGAEKLSELARLIVDNLRSPDILGIEEVQDNNGPVNDSTTDASATYAALITAIQAAGGPQYDYRQVDPVDDADGGQPGGNIRVGILFRTDVDGLAFVDRPGGGPTTATEVVGKRQHPQLSASPGRIDPGNPAFVATRKSLVGEFSFHGKTLFVIVNHFSSKGEDQPLFGRFRPPTRFTEERRHGQADAVHDFVADIIALDAKANVVVLGDMNDFEFSETLAILEGDVLHNLMETLPENERYSYVFEGNSQVLDQILVSSALFERAPVYDVVHVNAEFAQQASDHDPQVAYVRPKG